MTVLEFIAEFTGAIAGIYLFAALSPSPILATASLVYLFQACAALIVAQPNRGHQGTFH